MILLVYLYLATQGEFKCTTPEELPSTQVFFMWVVIILKEVYILHCLSSYTRRITDRIDKIQFEFHVNLGLFVPVRTKHLFMVYLVIFSVTQSKQDGQ